MARRKIVRKKQKRGLCYHYKDSWNFLKESGNYIWFVALLFFALVIFVFLGLQSNTLNQIILEKLQEIILEFEGLNTFQAIFKIFLNNAFASLTGIILGIFLGIFPVMFILVNSYIVGFVAKMSVEKEGILTLWKLFPHGVFELPAVIISFALGIRLGMFVLAKNPGKELKERFWKSLKVFLLIVLPLLVIAAIIEGILVATAGR